MQTSKRWLNAKRVGESTEKDLKIVSFRQPKWLKSCVCWCRRSIFSSSSILITIKAFLNITHKKWTRKHHHNTISFSSYVPSHRMNFFFLFFFFSFLSFSLRLCQQVADWDAHMHPRPTVGKQRHENWDISTSDDQRMAMECRFEFFAVLIAVSDRRESEWSELAFPRRWKDSQTGMPLIHSTLHASAMSSRSFDALKPPADRDSRNLKLFTGKVRDSILRSLFTTF